MKRDRSKDMAARKKKYREHMALIGNEWVALEYVEEFKKEVKDMASKTRKYAEPGEYHDLMENRISARALLTRTLEGES